jgi:hypothetical protein
VSLTASIARSLLKNKTMNEAGRPTAPSLPFHPGGFGKPLLQLVIRIHYISACAEVTIFLKCSLKDHNKEKLLRVGLFAAIVAVRVDRDVLRLVILAHRIVGTQL